MSVTAPELFTLRNEVLACKLEIDDVCSMQHLAADLAMNKKKACFVLLPRILFTVYHGCQACPA